MTATSLERTIVAASSLKDGSPRWQCVIPIGNDNDDVLSFGECSVYQALGITSLPYPKDEKGFAEAIVAPNVGNRKGVVIGARDTRNAGIVGKGDPGDTFMHSTGPNQAAQFRAQEKKRAASVVVQDKDGKHQLFVLDGQNKKAQIMVNGAVIEIDPDGDISLAGKGGAAILIQGDEIILNGVLRIPGLPDGMFLMAGPQTGQLAGAPGVAATTLLVPVPGVGRAG